MRKEPGVFLWGAATSACQIEGAATEDGKGLSIWDGFAAQSGKILDNSTPADACDHYHRWEGDLDILAELGANAYRFSISWPRIFPEGRGKPNARGMDFYQRLVDGMLARHIRPNATLYHWDLPAALEREGGWNRRDTCQAFADYAGYVACKLGDRVEQFATLNEPATIMTHGYVTGEHAPGKKNPWLALRVGHHLLLAHGLAVDAMRAVCPGAQIGLVNCYNPVYASLDSPMRTRGWLHDLVNRFFTEPVYHGTYPGIWQAMMRVLIGKKLGEDLAVIQRRPDFLGVNYYAPMIAGEAIGLLLAKRRRPVGPMTAMGWRIYPGGLSDLLHWLDRTYGRPRMYITENGAAFDDVCVDGRVEDNDRIAYLQDHMEAMLHARRQGVDVQGYYVWSLLDNFEWAFGYTRRFGLIHVDYATQKRIVKQSAQWYKQRIQMQGNELNL